MGDLKTDLADLRIDPDFRGESRKGLWIAVVVVVLAAVGAGAWWFIGARPVVVEALTVEQVSNAPAAGAVLNATGYVTARRRATVSAKMTGKVVEVNVEEGLHVKQGQVLARLDDSTIRAGLALAQAQLASARRAIEESEVRLRQAQLTLGRTQQLVAQGIVGQADLDAAQAEVDSLKARIAAAREQAEVAARQVAVQQTQLDDTVIRAPFSGVAISKDAQPGEMVSPVSAGGGFTRTGISTIVDMSSLEIEVDVSESYINRVTPGQTATAVLDAYPDWQIPAHVITTIPAADRQKATVLVRLAFGPPVPPELLPEAARNKGINARILPDMGVKVAFHGAQQSAQPSVASRSQILVPKGALRAADGNSYVFVIGSDRVERRAVKLGAENGDKVEVLSGLAPAERIVAAPGAELKDGDRIRVRQE